MKLTTHSEYLSRVLDGPEKFSQAVEAAKAKLWPILHKFDALAFRGMSGALLAPALSLRLNKHLIMVRKSLKDSHAASMVEGVTGGECRYIMVDDLISSGRTVHAIQQDIFRFNPQAKCVGLYLFNHRELYQPGDRTMEYAFVNDIRESCMRAKEQRERDEKDFLINSVYESIDRGGCSAAAIEKLKGLVEVLNSAIRAKETVRQQAAKESARIDAAIEKEGYLPADTSGYVQPPQIIVDDADKFSDLVEAFNKTSKTKQLVERTQ